MLQFVILVLLFSNLVVFPHNGIASLIPRLTARPMGVTVGNLRKGIPSMGISIGDSQKGTPGIGVGVINPTPKPAKPSGGVSITNPIPRTGNPPAANGDNGEDVPPPPSPPGWVGLKEEYEGKSMGRQFIIAHNKLRAKYNLKPVKWNRTLARFARRRAYKHVNDCEVKHSTDSLYGENLFWSLRDHWKPRDVVRIWGDEYKFYDPKTNECINNSMCGHYTQIVWHTTTSIGCARVTCNNLKGFLYQCSYYPPGNYYHEGPFGGKFSKSIVPPP